MQIDSVLPNRTSPGQSVIIQGNGLSTTERVFFDDQEVPFHIDGETLVVEVPDSSGTVALTLEGADGESDGFSITIE